MFEPVVFRGRITASGGDLAPRERPIWDGTTGPAGGTPPRRFGSIRRTTSLDMIWRDDVPGVLRLSGRGRDLLTGESIDATTIAGQASLVVEVDRSTLRITSASIAPDVDDIAGWLQHQFAHFRIRRALEASTPDFVRGGSLQALLVDDIPAAALIAGSSLIRSGREVREPGQSGVATRVCAGWIENGSMHAGLSSRPFLGEGPPAPDLACAGDPVAWHEEPPHAIGVIRRRRRIDVSRPDSEGLVDVDVLFRDSFVEHDGIETVIHEYGIDLTVDVRPRVVVAIHATPHVLPGPECPNAAGSAQRLVGMPMADIRAEVRDSFRGTSTCTHLNDALRSTGDLGVLLDTLRV